MKIERKVLYTYANMPLSRESEKTIKGFMIYTITYIKKNLENLPQHSKLNCSCCST